MKKAALFIFFFSIIIFSCKKSDDNVTPAPDPDPDPTPAQYSLKIRNNTSHDSVWMAKDENLYMFIKGGNSDKYCLKVDAGDTLNDTITSIDGVFGVPFWMICPHIGASSITFTCYGGNESQSPKQIVKDSNKLCSRVVTVLYIGSNNINGPVLSVSNSGLQGIIEASGLVMAITIRKSIEYQSVLIDSLTGTPPFIFNDNDYIGEEARYTVRGYVSDPWGGLVPSEDHTVDKQKEIHPPVATADETTLRIKWRKNNYTGFGNYSLKINGSVVATPASPNDTSYEAVDYGFPASVSVAITYVPKNHPLNWSEPKFSASIVAMSGKPFRYFDKYISVKGDDFYIEKNNYLIRYSTLSSLFTDSVQFTPGKPYSVSPGNKYIVFIVGSSYRLYNVQTGQTSNVALPPPSEVKGIAITDDGIAAVTSLSYLFKINMITGERLYFKPVGGTFTKLTISPQGNYLVVQNNNNGKILKITDENITEIAPVSATAFVSFPPEQEEKIIVVDQGVFNTCHVNPYYTFTTWPVQGTPVMINYNNNQLLVVGTYYRMYDLATGNLIKNVKCNNPDHPFTSGISGNKLYSGYYGNYMTY